MRFTLKQDPFLFRVAFGPQVRSTFVEVKEGQSLHDLCRDLRRCKSDRSCLHHGQWQDSAVSVIRLCLKGLANCWKNFTFPAVLF